MGLGTGLRVGGEIQKKKPSLLRMFTSSPSTLAFRVRVAMALEREFAVFFLPILKKPHAECCNLPAKGYVCMCVWGVHVCEWVGCMRGMQRSEV